MVGIMTVRDGQHGKPSLESIRQEGKPPW
jgi:hypothetical protein